jgi:SpoVK/Ycf46/Vps4 family AAA+-type ATPase
MLVNAIASEIGAHVFNLTPKNTAGQFVGKPNVTKMIHMAFKVAKANPPAVIYIDNFEMVFAKKVPKDDLSDPKRIKKDLLKNLKSLAPEDRVLFVGLSSKPWDGDAKVMLPIFEKFILCPKPDYPSRYMIWREFIGKTAPENVKEVNISLLSRLSAGMTTGQMKACAERVMTERRMKLVSWKKRSNEESKLKTEFFPRFVRDHSNQMSLRLK